MTLASRKTLLNVATLLEKGRELRRIAQRDANLAANLRVTPAFITIDEQAALLDWAIAMETELEANGPHRFYRRIEELAVVDPLYETIERRVEKLSGLDRKVVPEAKIGRYLSIIGAGGAVHAHRDSTLPGKRHLRCNLFLQLPEAGGRPIVLDTQIDIAPCALLSFFPSDMRHSSEPVVGGRSRIILSFGYTVHRDHRLP